MHELSLTQSLLEQALKNANSRRIVNVHLLIGPFSDEREENIQFYWRDLAKGTPGEGARLHFRHANIEMRCLGCGGTIGLENDGSMCEYCQSDHWKLSIEDEVRLERIDIE